MQWGLNFIHVKSFSINVRRIQNMQLTTLDCNFTAASLELMFLCAKLKLMNSLQLKVNFLPERKEENCSKLCIAAECVTIHIYFMVSHTIFLVNSIIVFLYVTWPNRCTTQELGSYRGTKIFYIDWLLQEMQAGNND